MELYEDAGLATPANSLNFAISGISAANPAQVDTNSHGFSGGEKIIIINVKGEATGEMGSVLNGNVFYVRTFGDPNKFLLYTDPSLSVPVNLTSFTPYQGSGHIVTEYGTYGANGVIVPQNYAASTSDLQSKYSNFYVQGASSSGFNMALGEGPPPGGGKSYVTGSDGNPSSASNPGLFGVVPRGEQSLQGGLITINSIRQVAATTSKGNMGSFGSFSRFVRHVDRDEQYYDSAVPKLLDIWRRLDRVPAVFDLFDLTGFPSGLPAGQNEILLYGITAGKASVGSGAGGSPASGVSTIDKSGEPFTSDWWGAFPFEPRFLEFPAPEDEDVDPEPILREFGETAMLDEEGRVAAAVYWITNDVYKGWGQAYTGGAHIYSGSLKGAISGSMGFDIKDLLEGSSIGTKTSDFGNVQIGAIVSMDEETFGLDPSYIDLAKSSLKVFYGIGDGVGNLITNKPENYLYPTSETYSGNGEVDSNGFYPSSYRVLRRASKPRGWRYGLINALPYKTSAVFRADSFGQFRDMLEGRPYAVVVNEKVKKVTGEDGTIEIGPMLPNNLQTQPEAAPVQVAFVIPPWSKEDNDSTNPDAIVQVPPGQTRSGNLSYYATSSLPFFDQSSLYPFGRDRPDQIRFDELTLVFAEESE